MRFAEINSVVIAAAAHIMTLVVVGYRVIALVHLQAARAMRCPTAAKDA